MPLDRATNEVNLAIADADLTVVHANDGYAAMLGRTVAQVEGRSAADWIHPDDVGEALAACRRVVANHAAASYSRRFIRSDGRILSVIGNLLPIDSGVGYTQIICCVRVLALPSHQSLRGPAVEAAATIADIASGLRDLAASAGLTVLSERLRDVARHAQPLTSSLYFVPHQQ